MSPPFTRRASSSPSLLSASRAELPPEMSTTHGACDGSDIVEEHIEVLRHRRKLPSAEIVAAYIPRPKNFPAPQEGEVVMFAEHFARGLMLPASNFFSGFLTDFGLHMHHLIPNTVLQLASFVGLCKGFLWIEPQLDLWLRLFLFKKSSVKDPAASGMRMSSCGMALVHQRTGFQQLPPEDSVKNWQTGFF
ncbi:hypothetical protein D1007_26924 [Hordeum vulgare]|nr:hypothetical protein D1007_26924 [Hordeum vulgare]